jgi:two-component system, NarL family, sensor kinase
MQGSPMAGEPATAGQATTSAGRVPARTAARVAWSLCAASLTLMTLAIVVLLRWRNTSVQLELGGPGSWAEQLAAVAGSLGAPVLGAVIASRQPRNRYGWLWCAIGFTAAVSSATAAYASYSYATLPGDLPGALVAAWLAGSASTAATGLLLFAFLLFPNGRLPSPGWRVVGWITAMVCIGYPLFAAMAPGPLVSFPFLTNPVGVGWPGQSGSPAISRSCCGRSTCC